LGLVVVFLLLLLGLVERLGAGSAATGEGTGTSRTTGTDGGRIAFALAVACGDSGCAISVLPLDAVRRPATACGDSGCAISIAFTVCVRADGPSTVRGCALAVFTARPACADDCRCARLADRKSTRLNSSHVS